jgi:hypothetical protein
VSAYQQAAAQAHGNHWSYLPSHSRRAGLLLACTQPTHGQNLKPHEPRAWPNHRQASLHCHACIASRAHAKHQNPDPKPPRPASGVGPKHGPGSRRCKRMAASAARLVCGLQTPSGAGRHQACDLAGTGKPTDGRHQAESIDARSCFGAALRYLHQELQRPQSNVHLRLGRRVSL